MTHTTPPPPRRLVAVGRKRRGHPVELRTLAPVEWRSFEDAEDLPPLPDSAVDAATRGLVAFGTISGTLHQACRTPVYLVDGELCAWSLSMLAWAEVQARAWNGHAQAAGLPHVYGRRDFNVRAMPDGLTADEVLDDARQRAADGWHWGCVRAMLGALSAHATGAPLCDGEALAAMGREWLSTLDDIATRIRLAMAYDAAQAKASEVPR